MYEKLISNLRERAAWINFPHHGEKYPSEDSTLMMDAADAIEDLEFFCNRYEKDYKALCAYLPKWIPVTERLPEEPIDVLCNDGKRVTVGYYIDAEVGWHDLHLYKIYPTHWMPLPTPPKEET